MDFNDAIHHPDPRVAAQVEEAIVAIKNLQPLPESVMDDEAPREPQQTRQWCQARYALARSLCDDQQFQHAAPLALQLVATRPDDARFSFIAGSCLQRLGLTAEAAQMYALSAHSRGASAVTLFRLGECWLALNEREAASRAFDGAFDLARNEPNGRVVQDMAARAIERLRRSSAQQTSARRAKP